MPLSILILSTNADLAGAPIHVRDLVTELMGRYQITVVFGESGPIQSQLEELGVTTHVVPQMRSNMQPLNDLIAVSKVAAIARTMRPTLIHGHSSKAGMIARLIGVFYSIPSLFTVHGWGFGPKRPALQSTVVRWIERRLSRYTCQYLLVSEADYDLGARDIGFRHHQAQVIANGVPDCEKLASPLDTADFIMVARTDRQKDHRTALTAFATVKTTARFSCVGAGTNSAEFTDSVRTWAGASFDRVRLMGTSHTIADLLASNGIMVLSSHYEGAPLAIIEGMRAGLAVIASDVGGVSRLIEHGVTGLLVPSADPEALAAAMQTLVDDPDKRQNMGLAGRQRYLARYTIGRMSDSVAAAYEVAGRTRVNGSSKTGSTVVPRP